jgi:hypothetical protein
MQLHATSPSHDWTGQATIVNYYPASPKEKPVLFINGKPVGPLQADWTDYEILNATAAELELLRLGGYQSLPARKCEARRA